APRPDRNRSPARPVMAEGALAYNRASLRSSELVPPAREWAELSTIRARLALARAGLDAKRLYRSTFPRASRMAPASASLARGRLECAAPRPGISTFSLL